MPQENLHSATRLVRESLVSPVYAKEGLMFRHAGWFSSSSCCFGSEKMAACVASECVISVVFRRAI